jgi:hypothetical protein
MLATLLHTANQVKREKSVLRWGEKQKLLIETPGVAEASIRIQSLSNGRQATGAGRRVQNKRASLHGVNCLPLIQIA